VANAEKGGEKMTPKLRGKPAPGNQRTSALPIEDIVPDPSQPRKTFAPDGLGSLADSLLRTGQISSIVVRPVSEGKYMIVVGERRWRAAKEAGLSQIDCLIRDDLDEQKAREMQFAENCQREDIPPLEQSRSWKQYLETYHVSQSELSKRTGIPQRTISDRLALLKLPASVHARIESGEIGPYEAVRIAALTADQQEAVAEAVASGRIGGRALEKLIRPQESPLASSRTPREASRPAKAAEATIGLSQKLENLERVVYELVAIYVFNEAAKEVGERGGKALPCPECLKRGGRGTIRGIRRRMTTKDRLGLIKFIESQEELSEDDKEALLKDAPTHVIEAKCLKCGFTELINYADE
jgi:ParB family chromosome partitioning protein